MYKKLSYLTFLAATVLGFAACSDQNEVVRDLYDEIENTPIAMHFEYTLVAADYAEISKAAVIAAGDNAENAALAKAVASSNSLNSFANAGTFIPARLAANNPGLHKGSSIQVTYNYSEEIPAYLADLTAAPTYNVTAADYATVWGADAGIGYLTPMNSPAAKLPAILKAAYPEAADGDIVVASYKYSDVEPNTGGGSETSPILSSEDFEGYTASTSSPYTKWEENGWTQIATKGDGTKYWQVRTYNNNKYGQVSANGGTDGITEAYMVSPVIDLSKTTGNILSFNVCVGYWNYAGLSVLVAEDTAAATTAPASVAWEDVTAKFNIPQEPASGYGVLSPAGTMSLDAYAGKKIRIAFKYYGEKGTGNTWTTTYQIDNVSVTGIATSSAVAAAAPKATVAARTRAAVGAPVTEKAIYTFSGGAWGVYKDAEIVNAADLTEMGVTEITAANASHYLPLFLAEKRKYAMNGDKAAVLWGTNATEYVLNDGVWVTTNAPVTRTEQFIYADNGWLFDPTVNYTMAGADHQLIVDYFLSNPELAVYVHSTYLNEEWYYGFNAHYNNVSFRLSYRTNTNTYSAHDTEFHTLDGDSAAQAKLLWKRLIEKGIPLFLSLKWPNAVTDVQGVEVYYNITINVYYPDGVANITNPYTFKYKVSKSAPSPQFEYISGAPSEYYPGTTAK